MEMPPEIPEIDAPDAAAQLVNGEAVFVDMRDPMSYRNSHIPGALQVTDETIGAFLENTSRDQKLIVYCYHGHNSLGGTAFFLDQGFRDVASLRGGFEEWRSEHPVEGEQA